MNITLQVAADIVTLSVHHPAPVPPLFEMAIGVNDSMLWSSSERLPHSEWEATSDEHGISMRRVFHGPFGMCTALRWCRATQTRLAQTLAIYNRQPEPSKTAPAYAMTFGLGEKQGLSYEELQAVYEQLPAQEFALGTFVLSQPTLRVTDPCYQDGTWCAGTLQAKPGIWNAKTVVGPTSWHTRVKALQISHESLGALEVLDYKTLDSAKLTAGVDSGQCGFFDDAHYPRDAASFEYEDDTFYGECCALTLDDGLPGGGVLSKQTGVVSRSGFGDGGYEVYVKRDEAGDVALVQLLYVDESAQDDEEDDSVDLAEAQG